MILIISDYHGHEQEVIKLIERHKPDYVLCCGDGQSSDEFYQNHHILSVLGNCDTAKLPLIWSGTLENQDILMTHGHLYAVYFDLNKLYYLALEHHAKYVFYGHTHIQKLEEFEGITFLNPGAILDGNYALLDHGKITLI